MYYVAKELVKRGHEVEVFVSKRVPVNQPSNSSESVNSDVDWQFKPPEYFLKFVQTPSHHTLGYPLQKS